VSSACTKLTARDNERIGCDSTEVIDSVLQEAAVKREPIRVEPISTYLERRRKGPICPVIVAGETVYVSGLPPFDPVTGEIKRLPFVQQAEIVLDQMKLCLEVARRCRRS
jgi:enamine deaminase RidA (YjgF/YER057c/UK114 family)